MAQMLVRPARHEFDFIEIVSSRRQPRLEPVLAKQVPQGLAHPADEIIGLDISDSPVPTRPIALLVFPDQLLFERDEKNDHGPCRRKKILRLPVLFKGNLWKDLEPLVRR